jgi:hypothetical protein
VGLEVDASGRARYYRACAIGGLVAALVFTWMLAAGRVDILRAGELSHLYDSQAHSLLEGRWDIPRDELGIEAWIVDGKAYTYFGPVPALLRMPIAAVTDRFDGRLTQLSMLAAFAVLMVFASRLGWRVRTLFGGQRPVGRAEAGAVGVFTFVLGAGSVVLFLASRPIVYHEAELWGAALAIAAYDFLLSFILVPRRTSLAWAGVFAGLAFLTRGSVGAGPVGALALLLLVRVLVAAHRRAGWDGLRAPLRWLGVGDEERNRGYLVPLALAVAIPAALYIYVNYARFEHPWSLPISQHVTVLEAADPMRIEALAANGGSQFGLKFVPTNVLAMLRPDGLRLDGLFPWLTFPPPADIIGGVKFDTVDWSGSATATMPLLFALGVVGAVAVFRRPETRAGPSPAALRVPVIGALAGGFVTLTIYFIAHRYMSDFLPLLVLLALAGLHLILRASASADRAVARVVAVGFVALAILSLGANFALALRYQRTFNEFLTPEERAAFIGFQQEVDELVPGGSRFDLARGEVLPTPEPGLADTLFVLGDCEGLYWSNGETWFAVERTAAGGEYPLRVTFPDRRPGTRETLLTAGTGAERDRVVVEYRDDDRVVFELVSAFEDSRRFRSDPVAVEPRRSYDLDVVVDPHVGRFDLALDGEPVDGFTIPISQGPVAIAGTDSATDTTDFSGTVEHVPTEPTLCRELVAAQ